MGILSIDQLAPPSNIKIIDIKLLEDYDNQNEVYKCDCLKDGNKIVVFIKVRNSSSFKYDLLLNEKKILENISETNIFAPRVVWFQKNEETIIALEKIQGRVIWDYIDPRREFYNKDLIIPYLEQYGEHLGIIHSTQVVCSEHKRPKLYDFLGEENVADSVFKNVCKWLKENKPKSKKQVFVHGDYNTANVIFHDDKLSGVIDWEFSGIGWREYDLAWALRKRKAFMNTEVERDAILRGYRKRSSFDPDALLWCEVLNYLHFGFWEFQDSKHTLSYEITQAVEIINSNKK